MQSNSLQKDVFLIAAGGTSSQFCYPSLYSQQQMWLWPPAAHKVNPCDGTHYVLLFFYGTMNLLTCTFISAGLQENSQHPVCYLDKQPKPVLVLLSKSGLLFPDILSSGIKKVSAVFTCKENIIMCNITLTELHIVYLLYEHVS